MYDWPEVADATFTFWQALKQQLNEAGFDAPDMLDHQELPRSQWLNDDLLFSQTCGYPFATKLVGKVHLLGTPVYDVDCVTMAPE